MVAITALNGRLPASLLSPIGGGERLRYDAADSYRRCLAAGMPPGGVREGYRDYATQERYYDDPPNHLGLAAVPGTSQHGWGVALDLDPAQTAWLLAHPSHGWRRTIRAESWHWEWTPALDQHRQQTPHQEDDMTPDQERMLREVHAALGAGGAVGLPDTDTVLGIVRHIDSQTNGLPDVVQAIAASTNGTPEALAALGAQMTTVGTALTELAGVVYAGTPGTPVTSTVYQRVKRIDERA